MRLWCKYKDLHHTYYSKLRGGEYQNGLLTELLIMMIIANYAGGNIRTHNEGLVAAISL